MGKGIIARTMADLLAQAKDPAEAARIQRAIDAGRNTILYHGTHTDFPAVDPSKVDLGLHVGTSEQATNRLADLYKRQDPNASRGSNKFTEGAQIMPLAVRPGKSLEMADVGDWDDSVQTALALRSHPEMAKHRELIDELLESVDYLKAANMATVEHPADRAKSWINSDDNKRALQEMNALLVGEGYGSVKYLNAAENTHGTAGAILPEYAEQLNEFRSAADDLRKLAGERKKQAAHAAITNRETAEQLLKYPKSPLGYLMPEERELFDKYASQISDIEMDPIYRSDPNSYIILNPYDQRSINAQFDPEFDLSPDLMKAEGGLVEDLPKFGKGQLFRAIQKGAEVVGEAPLKGAPESANIPGLGRTIIGPNPKAEEVAQRYAVESGIPYEPLREYPRLNTELSERIAKEYARMPAAPDDKEVRRAYDALIQETMGQYEQMLSSGVKPYFIDGPDPYAASPYLALKELYDTNRIGVFPTVEGFGSDAAFDPKNNPLLASTPYKISGRPALANDIFRAVHDYMGHAKPGVGFRAAGEEAAYQSHAGMFSPLARRALASETRGQNSWLNYGPFGEKNRSARIEDTIFADQKAGLLPRWAAEEGRTSAVDRRARFQRALRDGNTGLEGALTPEGRLALQHYSDKQLDRIDPSFYGTGLSGSTRSEMNRAGDRNFMDRWYAGLETDVDPYMIEGGLGPYKHTMLIDPELMYPLRYPALDDPDRLWRTGKPTLSEKRIADQNYSGYYYDHPALGNVAVMFDPLDVKKADGGLVELAHKYNKGGLIQKYQKGNLVRQWLKGYPEKSLAPLKRADVEKPEVAALNNWIDTSLAKYIKRDYGSPNDPLALLAPEQRHVPLLSEARMRDSQTNAVWPPKTDSWDKGLPSVSSGTLGYMLDPMLQQQKYVDKLLAENPWAAALPKETMVYGDVRVHDLGLQSLRDELYNALRPDTDLPDMLRLQPESLPRMSVAQASQLVGKINAWRAAESAKAELAASMNPATFIHKEYPEKNMRWVELALKDDTPESIDALNNALEYEGNEMGHSVGGYRTVDRGGSRSYGVGGWDALTSKKARIYSLRDAKGGPHVTIEVETPQSITAEMQYPHQQMINDKIVDYFIDNPDATLDDAMEGVLSTMEDYFPGKILQIKGKGNGAPTDKYLPFVQDFVRSQKWGDIGDLHHTGLRRAAEAFQPYSITKARAEGIDLPDYLTEQEIADITAKLQATNRPNGMKEGGIARPDVRDNPDNESYEESKRRKKTGVSMIDSLLDPMYAIRAGIRAQYRPSDVVWTDEDGNKHSYTAPGLANSTVGLGMFMPGDNPMSDAAMAAYTSGLNYENEMGGLPASEDMGKYTHFGNTLGEVLGQLPIGAAGISKGILSKAAMAIPDYLGPFMRPSVGNYASAALAGEALPHMIGGMMSLAERYGLGSDVPIDADESDRLLASLGIESAGRKIDNAGIDRYIAESEAREAARDRIAANVYGSLPRYGKGQLFKNVEKAVKGNGRSTIKGAERKAYPGIYRDPKELVTEASLQIPSESPALQQLFGVSRGDLADMALARETTEWLPPGAPSRGRGSAHAAPVMHGANTERLVNALNAAKGTDLGIGMQGWYMMDPAYQRLEVLYGPDEAKMMYDKFNTLTGIHSANSSVLTELNRGTAANWLDSEGRLGDYINYGGSMGAEGRPDDMAGVVGHMAHKTAHLLPAIRYLSSGVLSKEAKTPSYIAASQLAGMGNNVNFPVGDAHFSRAIGLADTRPGDTADIYGKSWSMPEAMQLHEWFTKDVAGEAGMQGVPAQATLWGVYAPQTGVKTSIGVPKLELLADMIMKTAKRLDVSPERARDLVLSGRAHAGFVDPELLGLMGLGGVGAAAAIGMKGDEDAKAIGGLVQKYGALTE